MSQNTGRVKPGRGGRSQGKMGSFGKPNQPRRSTQAKTTREAGSGAPAPLGKGPLVHGMNVTHSTRRGH